MPKLRTRLVYASYTFNVYLVPWKWPGNELYSNQKFDTGDGIIAMVRPCDYIPNESMTSVYSEKTMLVCIHKAGISDTSSK